MALAAVLAAAVSGTSLAQSPPPSPQPTPDPAGVFLDSDEIAALLAAFSDEPLTGGQVAPRVSRFVSPESFVFLQFDHPDPAMATALRYVGIGVKSVFCAETQPDPSFTHFHRYEADEYANGHGGDPGAAGYWLSWVAVDSFEARDGRRVEPGVDYEFSPTPPPSCGADIPAPDFSPPDADALTEEETRELMALFGDSFLTGGQAQPRAGKWVNEDTFVFLQGDASPAAATTVRYVGIGVVGVFCAEDQPPDFPHYHRFHAAAYREGHAGPPGESRGTWLLWVATQPFEVQDGRRVNVGVDREFSPTPAPSCADAAEASPSAAAADISVQASEWRFEPSSLTASVGQEVVIEVTNGGSQLHTFTIPSRGIDTGPIAPGETKTVTLRAPDGPATDEFVCTFDGHAEAGMVGELVIE